MKKISFKLRECRIRIFLWSELFYFGLKPMFWSGQYDFGDEYEERYGKQKGFAFYWLFFGIDTECPDY